MNMLFKNTDVNKKLRNKNGCICGIQARDVVSWAGDCFVEFC